MTQRSTTSLTTIPRGVWVLGFVSMLMDISSEMIRSLLPLFLVTALGTSVFAVGLIERLAESTALIVKVFSGALSDYLGRRKGIAVVRYGRSAVSKPLFAIATSFGLVVTARLLDRVGKGIRGAPRDALVADLTPKAMRGAALGLRQSLDTVGAFLGPLFAIGLMPLWSNDVAAALLPIMWGSGTGFEVMSRITAPIVSEMISSTVLTLCVIPALYALVKLWQLRRDLHDASMPVVEVAVPVAIAQ